MTSAPAFRWPALIPQKVWESLVSYTRITVMLTENFFVQLLFARKRKHGKLNLLCAPHECEEANAPRLCYERDHILKGSHLEAQLG